MATTMFHLILQDAKKRNVSNLVCDVSINNGSAKKLYEEIWGLKTIALRNFPLTTIKSHYQMTIDITNYPA